MTRSPTPVRRALLVAVVVVAVACSNDDGGDDDSSGGGTTTSTTVVTTTTTGTEAPTALPLAEVAVELVEVARLNEPVALAARPGSLDLYVAEKGGRIRHIRATRNESTGQVTYQVQSTPLLDLSGEVINQGEQGLLGLAFSSDGRKLYLNATLEPDGHTEVLEYQMGDGTSIDRGSRRLLLSVDQPFRNHNGGHVTIGPDGFLYIGFGDGGAGGDPRGNGQNPSTLLGSILRIDPELAGDQPYAIPPGNPFADGVDGAPETWLYGVRNPWRFSFDAETGDLWVADVGQNEWEEITKLPATGGFDAGRGANLGWNRMEGSHPFQGGENPPGAVLPVLDYGRDLGCTVIGGHVYRGAEIDALRGAYLFADLCQAGLRGIRVDGTSVVDERTWDVPVNEPYSFGEDDVGEVYVLLSSGPVLKLVSG